MSFSPIAIVGQGCVFPGALDPDSLWSAIAEGRDLTTPVPDGVWPVDPRDIPGPDGVKFRNGQAVPGRGGFVTGFEEIFDPEGFQLPSEEIRLLDPSVQWTLEAGRQALAGLDWADLSTGNTAVVLGNHSYPTASFVDIANRVLVEEPLGISDLPPTDTNDGRRFWANRFSSGRPAHLLAQAIGADGPAFCLDAACATSLYAIKLACDYLQDGTSDIALAGAVCGTDNIFLHLGFSEINALSVAGKSRPFDRRADGLLPAVGAGVLALKRLDDAIRDGDKIYAVIRGIGLSNDGRRGGLLTPAVDGQIEAMRQAYDRSGIDPATISLLECHATGTPAGDRAEVKSAETFFSAVPDLPVGSLKSNLGHLLTAAGIGAILKVIGAMENAVRPATLHAEEPLEEFAASNLRPLNASEAWPDQLRRAGINNFGFGGNNAHLILEQFDPANVPPREGSRSPRAPQKERVVICGIGIVAGEARNLDDLSGKSPGPKTEGLAGRIDQIELPFKAIKFPPADLSQSLPQQTAVLEAGHAALEHVTPGPPERSGVIVGMGCDVDAARPGLRYRLGTLKQKLNSEFDAETEAGLADAIGGLTGTGYVIGSMPNLPANRLNTTYDWRGLGYTVASEELSGFTALETAARALARHELDMAVASAVDFSDEPVHSLAARAALPDANPNPADAAIMFVLKREEDARKAGDPILATIDISPASGHDSSDATNAAPPEVKPARLGHAHAADAMVRASEALTDAINEPMRADGRAGDGGQSVTCQSFTGRRQSILLSNIAPKPSFGSKPHAPHLFFTAADSRAALAAKLANKIEGSDGDCRIAIVASDGRQLEEKVATAKQQLETGAEIAIPGVFFRDTKIDGEIAFLYPGSGVAYPGMAEDLASLYPDEYSILCQRDGAEHAIRFMSNAATTQDHVGDTAATTFVAALGTRVLRNHLTVTPDAAIGVSLGEVSMLVANDVWRDPKSVLDGLVKERFYEKLTSDHEIVARHLGINDGSPVAWQNHEVFAPVEDVKALVRDIPRVWVTIVSSPGQCTVSGVPEGCDLLREKLGDKLMVCAESDLSFHGGFAAEIGEVYRRIHTQPVFPAPEMRFYANATHGVVAQETTAICDSLHHQAVNSIDLQPTIDAAWSDGVRIFVDIGPRSALAPAVTATLEGRPHLAIGIASRGRDGIRQFLEAAAKLFVAGAGDLSDLSARLRRLRGDASDLETDPPVKKLQLPGHLSPVSRKTLEEIGRKGAAMKCPTPKTQEDPFVLPKPPVIPNPDFQMPRGGDQGANRDSEAGPNVLYPPRDFTLIARAEGAANANADVACPSEPAPTIPQSYPPRCPASGSPTQTTTKVRPSAFVASPRPVEPIDIVQPSGPSFDRAQLEILAGGKISDVFGPAFEQQDGFARQCRMPQPPMLLADRVLGISGQAGSMGKGICWTETDVSADDWYMHNDTLPTGLLIEAGQADLLLISWLGADFLNRDERVYRLLGCEITFHDGPLPRAGDTLRYQIHIDSHAELGDTRMFFFRYDARIGDRLVSSVRAGQAGFFSDLELAHSSGVLWSADADAPKEDARLDPAPHVTSRREFTDDEVAAFAGGDAHRCFGTGFENTAAHQRTPGIPSGRMQLIDRIEAFDPDGGPWGRGYLRAGFDVPTNAWFYNGHFKNDPCMPGTLMAEGAMQALGFYMAALGFTIDRDGWIFRPVTGEAFKFVCRGQVIPDKAHKITYEVFVEEVEAGDEPIVRAALLARCDGHPVFLCRNAGVKLARDWPLYERHDLLEADTAPRIVSPTGDVPGDHNAMLACALGRPSDAFGSMYARFDQESSVPRLPAPPYLCISRIASVDCAPGVATPGGKVVAEFDIDRDAWYFADSGNGRMPFSVLSEILLQPCGWLASYMGFALAGDLKFRNLDGSDVLIEREVGPDTGTLHVEATFTKSAEAGPMTIVFYEVVCRSEEGVVVSLKTDFGFFPAEALASQSGLASSPDRKANIGVRGPESPTLILADPFANADCAGSPSGRLDLVDEVLGFWPDGGKAKLGRATGRQVIDPSSWYFKSHFFEDPVQPGSLGLEALFNLFKAAVKLKGLHGRVERPIFEAPAVGHSLSWKYRGQVIPTNKEVLTEIDIVDITEEDGGLLVTAEGSLWVDGLRIYEVSGYALRIVPGGEPAGTGVIEEPKSLDRPRPPVNLAGWTADASVDDWLADHCPTYCIPVYPMMAVVADLLSREDGDRPSTLQNVEINSWIRLDRDPAILSSKTFPSPDGSINRQLFRAVDGVARRIGRAVEIHADNYPAAPPAWSNEIEGGQWINPYETGDLFHYEMFRLATDVLRSSTASRFTFDVGEAFDRARGHAGILFDVILHGIPHNNPHLWFGDAAAGKTAFPYRLDELVLHAPIPRTGRLDVLSRAAGMPTDRTIQSEVQVIQEGTVIMTLRLTEALVPTGAFDKLAPKEREAFARKHRFVEGWSLAELSDAGTSLKREAVRRANWLPGTLESFYGLPTDGTVDEHMLTTMIAIKDHFAVRHRLHPADVTIKADQVIAGAAPPVSLSDLAAGWVDAETFEVSKD